MIVNKSEWLRENGKWEWNQTQHFQLDFHHQQCTLISIIITPLEKYLTFCRREVNIGARTQRDEITKLPHTWMLSRPWKVRIRTGQCIHTVIRYPNKDITNPLRFTQKNPNSVRCIWFCIATKKKNKKERRSVKDQT